MRFVSHIFYPWGFILQILALVHYFRRRAEWYWFWIILIGGALGALIYIIAEVLPDAGLIRGVFQSHGRKSRIAVVEGMIIDNPSVANLERSWASCIGMRSNTRRRARHSTAPSKRGATRRKLSTAAAFVPWK